MTYAHHVWLNQLLNPPTRKYYYNHIMSKNCRVNAKEGEGGGGGK